MAAPRTRGSRLLRCRAQVSLETANCGTDITRVRLEARGGGGGVSFNCDLEPQWGEVVGAVSHGGARHPPCDAALVCVGVLTGGGRLRRAVEGLLPRAELGPRLLCRQSALSTPPLP